MASIRERKGKFNVIYNYKDDSGKRKQKWETWSTEETDVLSLEQSFVGFFFLKKHRNEPKKRARYGKINFLVPMRVVRQKQSILV